MDTIPAPMPTDPVVDALLTDWLEQTKTVQDVYGISREGREQIEKLLADKKAKPANSSVLRMPTVGTSAALRSRRLSTLIETITQLKADMIDTGGIPTRFYKYVEELSIYTSKSLATLQPKTPE